VCATLGRLQERALAVPSEQVGRALSREGAENVEDFGVELLLLGL
jgi:hypothetical protein